jgi:hypothetical protein
VRWLGYPFSLLHCTVRFVGNKNLVYCTDPFDLLFPLLFKFLLGANLSLSLSMQINAFTNYDSSFAVPYAECDVYVLTLAFALFLPLVLVGAGRGLRNAGTGSDSDSGLDTTDLIPARRLSELLICISYHTQVRSIIAITPAKQITIANTSHRNHIAFPKLQLKNPQPSQRCCSLP